MADSTSYVRFSLWAAAGALLGLVTVVFGVPGLAVLAVAAVFAGSRRAGGTSLGGLLVGVGIPLLWLGYIVGAVDRTCGSGDINDDGTVTCTQWEAAGSIRWPWFLAAAVVIAVGAGLQVRARRRRVEEQTTVAGTLA